MTTPRLPLCPQEHGYHTWGTLYEHLGGSTGGSGVGSWADRGPKSQYQAPAPYNSHQHQIEFQVKADVPTMAGSLSSFACYLFLMFRFLEHNLEETL